MPTFKLPPRQERHLPYDVGVLISRIIITQTKDIVTTKKIAVARKEIRTTG